MAHEAMRGVAWVLATLRGDSTFTAAAPGGVYLSIAPQTVASTPYGLVTVQAATDELGAGANRLWADVLLQVVAIGPNDDLADLVSAADAIDAALNLQTGTAQGGTVHECVREQSIVLSEIVPGDGTSTIWTRVGGLYRLLVQK